MILFSYLPFIYDYYSDITLAKNYYDIAFSNETVTNEMATNAMATNETATNETATNETAINETSKVCSL